MDNRRTLVEESPHSHFGKRAKKYNRSSHWVDDPLLVEKIRDLSLANSESYVLDLAIGTGKVAAAFYKNVKYLVGLDISGDMVKQATPFADRIVLSPAEKMPFKNDVFDICVCRQGLQFMDADKVMKQVHRTLKPYGVIVLCHLTAYGEEDSDIAFHIQQLRNPARKNFFLPKHFSELLEKNNFVNIECSEYITRESVNQWIDNGAIDHDRREKIKSIYRNAPDNFKRIHKIHSDNGDFYDSMKLLIIKGTKA